LQPLINYYVSTSTVYTLTVPLCHLHCHCVNQSVTEEEQWENFSSDKAAFQQPVIGINAHTLRTVHARTFHMFCSVTTSI